MCIGERGNKPKRESLHEKEKNRYNFFIENLI